MNWLNSLKWVAFDADDTLFEYRSYQGIRNVLARYNVMWSETEHQQFQLTNVSLWLALQNGQISMNELAQQRFNHLAQRTGQTAEALNYELQLEMAHISQAFDGVSQLLSILKQKGMGIAIITNGFTALQQPRLEKQGIAKWIDVLVDSETVGYAKPNRKMFEAALAKMGNPAVEEVLMVGDNLMSDVLGAKQIGMKTCWFRAGKAESHLSVQIADFVVDNWFEFAEKLGLKLN